MVACVFKFQISQPKLGQIAHVGGVLKLSEPADSKTYPGFKNRTRFEGVIGQNKIQQTYDHDCIYIYNYLGLSLLIEQLLFWDLFLG